MRKIKKDRLADSAARQPDAHDKHEQSYIDIITHAGPGCKHRICAMSMVVRVIATVLLIILLAVVFCAPARSVEQKTAGEYLHAIGADNAQSAHLMGLYEKWSDENEQRK